MRSGKTLSENVRVKYLEIQNTVFRDLTSERSLNLETAKADKSRQCIKRKSRDLKPKTHQSYDISKVDKSVTDTKGGKEEEASEIP